MQKIASALLVGAVFGLGIAISGMANPAKVLNFFDIAGAWDPSLALVMASALAVTAIGYRLVFARQPKPVLEPRFDLPTARRIDAPLVAGSAAFGVGWGVTGFCPGGAVPALGLGHAEAPVFVVSMMAGILVARVVRTRLARPVPA